MAVAQALCRLWRKGMIARMGKGLYYMGRHTAFGPIRPILRALLLRRKGVFASGTETANLLGCPMRCRRLCVGPSPS